MLASSLAAAPWTRAAAQDAAAEQDRSAPTLGLDQFLRMSRVLTGFDDLQDDAIGSEYFEALATRTDGTRRLAGLWRRGGFDDPETPASVEDLAARGVYDAPDLAELADTITGNWYSGTYVTADGELRVA
ncbi:MAG: hypothetical protein JXB36_05635, partial [Gammaproteobacteria bacterium]|nr:hypothetical protein [Gammaproteobacteria bacterium]